MSDKDSKQRNYHSGPCISKKDIVAIPEECFNVVFLRQKTHWREINDGKNAEGTNQICSDNSILK